MSNDIHFDGSNAGFQAGIVNGNVTAHLNSSSDLDEKCLRDLRITDPRDDKKRIEREKGGLLEASYSWIINNEQFRGWQEAGENCLLWVKGDPGKGKTMLLCGIIDYLTQTAAETTIAFFFCQGTEVGMNSATAVLRGLIYSLVIKKPQLLAYVQKRYDTAGKQLFEDVNSWEALSTILVDILSSSLLKTVYLIIDALDECSKDRSLLLDLVSRDISKNSRMKWIVSSRNWPSIEERLKDAPYLSRVDLELNDESVSESVNAYIQHKVIYLTKLKSWDQNTRELVHHHLRSNSEGTFLWVALVAQALERMPGWKSRSMRSKLESFPKSLSALYEKMLEQVLSSDHEDGEEDDADVRRNILATVSTTLRPLTLSELMPLLDLPSEPTEDEWQTPLVQLVATCGSFLAIREDSVIFIHHSAKDFLTGNACALICTQGIQGQHYLLFERSMEIMHKTLERDIYRLKAAGTRVHEVDKPHPDPLARAAYFCLYWIDHLEACDITNSQSEILETGQLENFLTHKLLNWFESISLLRAIYRGIAALDRLKSLAQQRDISLSLYARIKDACRFLRYHRLAIEAHPLQTYHSALIFSPNESITRQCYQAEIPLYIANELEIEKGWGPISQTLKIHDDFVYPQIPIGWSEDGVWFASSSSDFKVRIWDSATGEVLWILEGCMRKKPRRMVFSRDRSRLAVSADGFWGDHCVIIWNLPREEILTHGTLVPYIGIATPGYVTMLALSSNGNELATRGPLGITIWSLSNKTSSLICETRDNWASAMAWSPREALIACGETNGSIQVWHKINSRYTSKINLESHSQSVNNLSWSSDGKYLASISIDQIKVFEVATATCIANSPGVKDVSFVIWTNDRKLTVFHANCENTSDHEVLTDHDLIEEAWAPFHGPKSLPIFGNEEHIAYSSTGRAAQIKNRSIIIRDQVHSPVTSTANNHIQRKVFRLKWSPLGNWLALMLSSDIQIWNPVTGHFISGKRTAQDNNACFESIAWSPDDSWLALETYSSVYSRNACVEMWNPTSAERISSPYAHYWSGKNRLTWSANGLWLAAKLLIDRDDSGRPHSTEVRIWDMAQRKISLQLPITNEVGELTCSPTGCQLAWCVEPDLPNYELPWDLSKSQFTCFARRFFEGDGESSFRSDRKPWIELAQSKEWVIKIYEPASGIEKSISPDKPQHCKDGQIVSIAWSSSGHRLVAAFRAFPDNTVRHITIWDTRTSEIISKHLIRSENWTERREALHFDDTNGYKLHTDDGAFDLEPAISPCVEDQEQVVLDPIVGYGLNRGCSWLTFGGEGIFLIPDEYRDDEPSLRCTSWGACLAFALSDDQILVLHLIENM